MTAKHIRHLLEGNRDAEVSLFRFCPCTNHTGSVVCSEVGPNSCVPEARRLGRGIIEGVLFPKDW